MISQTSRTSTSVGEPLSSRDALVSEAERTLRHFLGAVINHFDDPKVNEIMINGPDSIFVEAQGEMRKLGTRLSATSIDSAIRSIMTLNTKDPELVMDARLVGVRVAAALPPVAINGPLISVRKHSTSRITLEDYVSKGGFDVYAADSAEASAALAGVKTSTVALMEREAAAGGIGLRAFFEWAMHVRKNIMVVGGTSSGKTTLLGALLRCIPSDHRIITVEDTHELTVGQPNVVQLEAQHQRNVTIRTLIRLCLRLRPDRIIVGEVRGAEAYDLLDSMNTGHPGSAFTLHGESPLGGLTRLESLIRMAPAAASLTPNLIRLDIASAIDYVVFASRVGHSRGTEQVIALDSGLTRDGGYRMRTIFDRLGAVRHRS